jgi:hypothetical protein
VQKIGDWRENHIRQQESSFSEEKEAKRLSPFAHRLDDAQTGKRFLVLFFKKEPLACG